MIHQPVIIMQYGNYMQLHTTYEIIRWEHAFNTRSFISMEPRYVPLKEHMCLEEQKLSYTMGSDVRRHIFTVLDSAKVTVVL